ncbi:hypothetical protein PENTCL1PPCAC_30128 [Pristionchus entomophagus]|uniref:Ribosomal protein n=1 Tax=Pristionchus entomophagus TaxID=358040 RepID=A0AAV5ULL5_9BILA|nr:hypothetical protein PENTCL1PPCAC_30128 [Pristionchus entomophagus]
MQRSMQLIPSSSSRCSCSKWSQRLPHAARSLYGAQSGNIWRVGVCCKTDRIILPRREAKVDAEADGKTPRKYFRAPKRQIARRSTRVAR